MPITMVHEQQEDSIFLEASQLHSSGADLRRAETLYRAVLTKQPRHAQALHQLGALLTQLYGKEKLDEARQLVSAAIQLQPSCAKFRNSLGVVFQTAGRWREAADAFERANEKDPMNVAVMMNLARALREVGRQQRAAEVYGAVTKLQPDHPSAHYRRGAILRSVRRNEEALAAFRQHLRLHPDHQASRFWIAAITGDVEGMAAAPPEMVSGLFDQYADHFDDHLVNKLQYKTPEALRDQLLGVCGDGNSSNGQLPSWRRCVDLGCGTGLMGPLLQPYCAVLEGVDLSAGMVDQAAKRGCYSHLEVSELVAFLEQEAAATAAATITTTTSAASTPSPSAEQAGGEGDDAVPSSSAPSSSASASSARCCLPYELLVAADVFVYIGDLLPVMRAAAAAAAPGAVLAFSTEALELAPSGKANRGLGAAATPPAPSATPGPTGPTAPTSADGEWEEGSNVGASGGRGDAGSGASGGGGCPVGLRLQVTGRYAHSEDYLRRTGAACGWALRSVAQSIIRYNGGDPIWGHLVVMVRTGAAGEKC